MKNKRVGIIGSTSLVGQSVISILKRSSWHVVAFSRQVKETIEPNVEWRSIPTQTNIYKTSNREEVIPIWICCAPIWVLQEYFDFLKASGVKRIVAVSSTSRFTKEASQDPFEQDVAQRLIESEAALQDWAENNGVDWCILRPTMIYGLGKDKNISEIMRLIKRWGFFPILGKGHGLRQPVHVNDVSKACQAVIETTVKQNKAYNISGGETLFYKEMVKRIFIALNMKPRFIHVPRWAFRLALLSLRMLPRFRHWSVAMADRMDRDLVFDHEAATAEFGFAPRPFLLEERDLP